MDSSINDIWYAARKTRVVYLPRKLLETFGETIVGYSLLTPLDENGATFRVRTGTVKAARPRIITPHFFAKQALENFGEEARSYFEDILSRQEGAAILEYGLGFSKEQHAQEDASGSIQDSAERLAKEAQDNLNEIRGVLIGSEAHWEVSLIYFLRLMIEKSAPVHAQQMSQRGLFSLTDGMPSGVRMELNADFQNCHTREEADRLGKKLRDYGVFDSYEEPFFQLYSRFV